MSSSRNGVRCTVNDGAVSMHLDNARVDIPPNFVKESQMLLDIQSSEDDPSMIRDFSLDVPEEWLRAWTAFYCSEEKQVGNADVRDLSNCLMVWFRS
jgi:hypothetical protein